MGGDRPPPQGTDSIASALRAISLARQRPFSMQNRAGRFRIQKTVYLLKELGYAPACRFGYGLYLKGPYSPDLARSYYHLRDNGLQRAKAADDLSENQKSTVLDALRGSNEFLEALATSISVCPKGRAPLEAVSKAKPIKPQIPDEVWGQVRTFLEGHPRLIART